MTDTPNDVLLQKIQSFIQWQYAQNTSITLAQLCELDSSDAYQIHPDLSAFIKNEQANIHRVLDEELYQANRKRELGILGFFLEQTQSFIFQNNQFIALETADQQEMARLYENYLARTNELIANARSAQEIARQLRIVVSNHLAALQGLMIKIRDANSSQGASLVDRHVVCEEYSAKLQLGVLGIDLNNLVEPVLDVGCGRRAALVRYLRQLGFDAYGVDRLAAPLDYLARADWLQTHFRVSAWGTILSHMAFSNHFLFHHLYRNGAPELYAEKYMEILRSLKPGGTLYYTPGLPFIERFLPAAEFIVQKQSIPLPNRTELSMGSGYHSKLVEDTFYATRVIRLGNKVAMI